MDTHTPSLPLDAFAQYLREVNRVTPLTSDDEARLLAQMAAGDMAARDWLVAAYQPFILGIAKRFQRRCELLDLLDLAQEGSIGLLGALAAQHERTPDMPLRAWVWSWASKAMLHAIYRSERCIRLPARTLKRLRQLVAAQTQLLGELGREATIDELATMLDLPQPVVLDLLLLHAEQFVSLDAPLTDDAGAQPLADMLAAPDDATLAQRSRLHAWLRSVVERLPERERAVITLRYGFDGDAPRSMREIADLLGLSPSLVREVDRRVRLRLQVAMQRRAPALVA